MKVERWPRYFSFTIDLQSISQDIQCAASMTKIPRV